MQLQKWLPALLAGLILTGCGGTASSLGGDTRGEGDIPVGRRMRGVDVLVRVTDSQGTVQEVTPESDGTIWFDGAAEGEATIEFVSQDQQIESETIGIDLGDNQRFLFNFEPEPVNSGANVTGLVIELKGKPTLIVGQRYQVKVTVQGENIGGVKPTVWVNGGLGSLDSAGGLTILESGSGSVCAKACGVTATLEISVP